MTKMRGEPGERLRKRRGRNTAVTFVSKTGNYYGHKKHTDFFLFSVAEEQEKSPICQMIGHLCGQSVSSQSQENEEPEVVEKMPDIREHSVWRHVVDVNAIIMMSVAVFLWGYYA